MLHVDGIVFASGRVVLLAGRTVRAGTRVRSVVSPLAESSIESILSYASEPWVPVTRLATVSWSSDIRVECGEGAMGNEGFVAAVNTADNSLIWALFSSHSNPFVSVARDGDEVVVEGGYDQVWRLPFSAPEKFAVHEDVAGKATP
jgi:hypothetical protein